MKDARSLKELEMIMKALSNPVRMTIVGSLAQEPKHIYALAKELKLSYPLVHLYVDSLERVGLVEATQGTGPPDQRERKFYRASSFHVELTPERLKKMYEEAKNHE